MSNWYYIRTKWHKERWLPQQLVEIGSEACLPLLRERRKVCRQLKWVVEPLFPSYLFSCFPIDEAFHVVHHTPGLESTVGTPEDVLLTVDEQIIFILHERSQDGCYIEINFFPFSRGEELQVVAGPFKGHGPCFKQELKLRGSESQYC